MVLKNFMKSIFGDSAEQKARHQKWSYSGKESDLSKRVQSGHQPTQGKM